MGFIPDLGVADSKKETSKTALEDKVNKRQKEEQKKSSTAKRSQQEKKSGKKVVSYNLEVELIDTIKSIAQEKDMYYSTFVSMVLKSWISHHSQS